MTEELDMIIISFGRNTGCGKEDMLSSAETK
jgi:hypothetical protein